MYVCMYVCVCMCRWVGIGREGLSYQRMALSIGMPQGITLPRGHHEGEGINLSGREGTVREGRYLGIR